MIYSSQMNQLSILGYFCSASQSSKQQLIQLIEDATKAMCQEQLTLKLDQWKALSLKLNTNQKLSQLRFKHLREIFVELIRTETVHLYHHSYFNRAKLTAQHIEYLKEIGPYYFKEVVTIVSKLNVIHQIYYLRMSQNIAENHIDHKILRILGLCNDKKRSTNNNLNKFLAIVEDQQDRNQLILQLGKMLRQAWKDQKTLRKHKKDDQPDIDQEQFFNEANLETLPFFTKDSSSDLISNQRDNRNYPDSLVG